MKLWAWVARAPLAKSRGLFRLTGVSWTWCNGEFLEGPLAVSPADRGLTHGYGLFETLLALDGMPVALDLHLARMRAGAVRLGLDVGQLGEREICASMCGLLERSGFHRGRARVRLAVSAGVGDLRDLAGGSGSLMWMTVGACPPPPESLVLITASFPRNERSPLAGLKSASYVENLIALDEARRAGADEVVFFNTRGELCEAATANLFLVRDGRIFTPPLSSGCLPGTMRARVMARMPVIEQLLTAADLAAADEVFVTSATRGVVPVVKLDGRELPMREVAQLCKLCWGGADLAL
ncbi:MAG: 4-amino-4-deoxychorismate lyase [Verrucomicrobia bacterium]|nr:MAG: 4-amino-4-deoxychorismate lyase [Verrucomicrobiota bacterium]TAE87109.1 MAG: 4-amino-4-deoxychorismate lyase [Verrucomicrobiota bacterium]TAF24913.1 MAG: 4-amino-4-deoxychorismate lyase [Verrucomicrobiota bacterium]TAF40760.1 MAG: 4-amino-4-deoxychorismate lyase [Verrucomicrobiota bacterium]